MKNLLILIFIFILIICLVVKKEESFNNIKSKNIKSKNNKKNIRIENSVGHFNIYIPSIKHD